MNYLLNKTLFFKMIIILGTSGLIIAGSSYEDQHKGPFNQIIQAVEDEIYVNGFYSYYGDMGTPGDDESEHILNIYFGPVVSGNHGWVIYKLMPKGEVYRMYQIRVDESIVLYGDPEHRFPPTQPSYMTVYMDDDVLCKLKRDWVRKTFKISTKPTQDTLNQARARHPKRSEFK